MALRLCYNVYLIQLFEVSVDVVPEEPKCSYNLLTKSVPNTSMQLVK